MNAESAIRSALLADPAVAALVGTRIGPLKLLQNPELPAIVYERISTPGDPPALDGAKVAPRIRVQLSLWAASFDAVRQLAAAVDARLSGYSGPNGDGTSLRLVWLANLSDDYEPETGLYRVIADYRVIHTEGVAA
jgi:hypothetical protein